MNNNIVCPNCGKSNIIKNGKSGDNQKYKCKSCGKNFIETIKVEEVIIPREVIKKEEKIIIKQKKDRTEEYKIGKSKYKNNFDQPKFSKKFNFEFNSWFEYHQKKSKLKKKS